MIYFKLIWYFIINKNVTHICYKKSTYNIYPIKMCQIGLAQSQLRNKKHFPKLLHASHMNLFYLITFYL